MVISLCSFSHDRDIAIVEGLYQRIDSVIIVDMSQRRCCFPATLLLASFKSSIEGPKA